MADPSIRVLIDHVLAGRIRIPAFQRGFVWDAERVAFFMDSLYKGYPFGSLLLWRTRNQLRAERQLGPYALPLVDPEYPIDYVLDGQQRLTSIFGVFQTEVEPDGADDVFTIYFDRIANPDVQEPQFFALASEDVNPTRHFPLRVLFDVVKYRAATEGLEAHELELLDTMQTRFREVTVPVQTFETDDKASVAIVFERVNRLGIELDTLQLLSAWTWSDDFFLQDEFADLAETLEPFGFRLVGEDTNLLLRCCAAVIRHEASPGALMQLIGAEVRERFDEIVNGIMGAIDFLRRNLHVHALKNLPFGTLIVPLSVFFATPGSAEVRYSDAQRRLMLQWFWRSCFARRYSNDVIRKLELDIQQIAALKAGETSRLNEIAIDLRKEFFLNSTFNTYGVNTKTLILQLAQFDPISFVSGARVSLERVLQEYNRNEFHHCYPRKYLKALGRQPSDFNRLANFVFMSAADNKVLGGVPPSEYRSKMNEDAIEEILGHALCPESLFGDDYDTFVDERAALLVVAAERLCEGERPGR